MPNVKYFTIADCFGLISFRLHFIRRPSESEGSKGKYLDWIQPITSFQNPSPLRGMRMRWKTLTLIIWSTFSVILIKMSRLRMTLRSTNKDSNPTLRPSSVMIQKPIGKRESTSSNNNGLMPAFVKVIEHFSDSVIIEYIHYDVVSYIC